MLHPDGSVPHSRLAPAVTFVGFALVAAVFQVLATLLLGLAPLDEIQRASQEGSQLYLIGALGTAIATTVLWTLRRKPLLASIVFLVLELGLLLSLVADTTRLGLAYHGEFILHHFVALLCAAACISLGLAWIRNDALGRARWIAGTVPLVASGSLLIVHALGQPGIEVRVPPTVEHAAIALAVLSPICALAALWRHTQEQPRRLRILTIAVMVPLLVRVLVGLPRSLNGAPVPEAARTWVMLAVILAAMVAFWAFRPEMPRPLRVIVVTFSGLATAVLYLVYVHPLGFVTLENGLGGIAQSLFGFSPPYPSFVPHWKVLLVCTALFCIFSIVYGGLLSWDERVRGGALGLYAVAGIGLSNIQLVLMVSAALLVLVHSLLDDDEDDEMFESDMPIEDILRDAADLLELPEPTILEAAEGTVVSLRGAIDGTQVDLRARPTRARGWKLSMRVGVIGRGRPLLELTPDGGDSGARPAHELARTHRVMGDTRHIETLDDAQLDALTPFASSNVRFYDAGVEVELGSDLSRLDAPRLAALLSSSASAAT